VSLPSQPIWLRADAPRLAQVFANLLNNSSKYTGPGGSIAVEAALDGNGNVVVAVTDSGIGIPQEKLETIFDMFTQVQRPLERTQAGLGIGLTLVRRLVAMHGGTIEARSEGDARGSTFIVRLPTISAPQRAPEATTSTAPAVATAGRRRILIVDDNRDSAESLATLLTMTGNETITAHDGEAAVAAAERHRPDIILLDIGLPKMNGYDVCRHLRRQPWGRDILTVALTGWGQEADRRRSRESGFDGHLVKPVDYDALLHLIHAPREGASEQAPGNARH
jgi:CheY-like chemotaxis protein